MLSNVQPQDDWIVPITPTFPGFEEVDDNTLMNPVTNDDLFPL